VHNKKIIMEAKKGKTYLIKYTLEEYDPDNLPTIAVAGIDIRGYDDYVFRDKDGIVYRPSEWEAVEEVILISTEEIQSNSSRMKWAQGLITQLPTDHDGRNSWLLNYGTRTEDELAREEREIRFIAITQKAETRG